MSKLCRHFFILLLLLCAIKNSTFAQKQANFWYFGSNTGLNFNGGPSKLTTTLLPIADDIEGEGFSTLSDENGNLLLHTNGTTVYDKNLVAMQNGTGLLGHPSSAQCATVFPIPGNTKPSNLAKYIVVTTPESSDNSTGIRFSVVNMDSAAYPTGAVTNIKNIVMPGGPAQAAEALVSCPHFNGNDVWVVGHDKNSASANFYAWKVSANSSGTLVISAPVVSSIGNPLNTNTWPYYGISVMKFNSCFNRLALSYYSDAIVQGFSFDNSTGVVGNWPSPVSAVLKLDLSKTISANTGDASHNYGLEFSPNGTYLFATQTGEGTNIKRIYRFDLSAGTKSQTDIESSRAVLYSDNADATNNHRLGHLQLGSDGKIYATHYYRTTGTGTSRIDVINTPNTVAHGYTASAYTWSTAQRTSMGLPSFHKGFLAGSTKISAADSTSGTAISDLGQICEGIATVFESKYTGNGSLYTWDVNAPNHVSPSYGVSSDSTKAYHRYTAPGDYMVVITLKDKACNYTVTDTATIKVNPAIIATGAASCANPNVTLNVTSTPTTGKTYVWYKDAAATQVFATGTSTTFTPAFPYSGTYYLKEVASATPTPTTTTLSDDATSTRSTTSGTQTWGGTLRDSLIVTASTTLKTIKFDIPNNYYEGTSNSRSYKVELLRVGSPNTSVSSQNIPITTNSSGGGATYQTGTVTFNQALTAGKYIIEISTVSPGKSEMSTWNPIAATSISNVVTIKYAGTKSPFYDLVFDYSNLVITDKTCSRLATVPVNCSLPVTFVNFTAQKSGSGALLSWSTAKEDNNSHFIVERSVDGVTYTQIGLVTGKGNTHSVSNYSYSDASPVNGINYYRVRQVDYDGTNASTTDTKTVSFNGNAVLALVVKPNPSNGQFVVEVTTEEAQIIDLHIVSVLGATVWNESINSEGFVSRQIDLSGLAKGVYIVRAAGIAQKIIVE